MDEDLKILQVTGTSHLLAISGLHLGFITSAIFGLSCWLWRKLVTKNLLEKIPAPRFAAIISVICAIIYTIIIGLNIPIVRSLWMTLGYLGTIIFRKFSDPKDGYFEAMLLLLCLDPFYSLSLSFWLSFTAVGILLYGNNPKIYFKKTKINLKLKILIGILNLVKTNLLMLVGLIPINLIFFGKVNLISLFANFIAIPWITFLVLPSMLLGLLLSIINLYASKYCMIFADLSLNWLLKILKIFTKFNIELILEVSEIKLIIFWLSLVGSLWLLLPKGLVNKYIALVCFMPMILPIKKAIKFGDAIVTVLDVGQGLGIVIKLQKHIILYDVGPNNLVMEKFLQTENVKSIDQIIISHPDYDHVGALASISEKIKIQELFISNQEYKVINLQSKDCSLEHFWEVDGVKFNFFKPPISNNKNDNSCILKMTGNNYSVLYTGDISKKTEKALIAKYNNYLQADLLLIPHHGSANSSTTEFIKTVKPRYAIVSAGLYNQYRHPRKNILYRYFLNNITVLNTVVHGSIELKLYRNSNNMEINLYKNTHSFFWNY